MYLMSPSGDSVSAVTVLSDAAPRIRQPRGERLEDLSRSHCRRRWFGHSPAQRARLTVSPPAKARHRTPRAPPFSVINAAYAPSPRRVDVGDFREDGAAGAADPPGGQAPRADLRRAGMVEVALSLRCQGVPAWSAGGGH